MNIILHGVMAADIRNRLGDSSSNLKQGCMHFTLHQCLRERYQSNSSPRATGK